MNFRIVLTIIGFFILFIFILQNSQMIDISFLFWSFKISKILVAIFCVLLGFLLGSYFWLRVSQKDKNKVT